MATRAATRGLRRDRHRVIVRCGGVRCAGEHQRQREDPRHSPRLPALEEFVTGHRALPGRLGFLCLLMQSPPRPRSPDPSLCPREGLALCIRGDAPGINESTRGRGPKWSQSHLAEPANGCWQLADTRRVTRSPSVERRERTNSVLSTREETQPRKRRAVDRATTCEPFLRATRRVRQRKWFPPRPDFAGANGG